MDRGWTANIKRMSVLETLWGYAVVAKILSSENVATTTFHTATYSCTRSLRSSAITFNYSSCSVKAYQKKNNRNRSIAGKTSHDLLCKPLSALLEITNTNAKTTTLREDLIDCSIRLAFATRWFADQLASLRPLFISKPANPVVIHLRFRLPLRRRQSAWRIVGAVLGLTRAIVVRMSKGKSR